MKNPNLEEVLAGLRRAAEHTRHYVANGEVVGELCDAAVTVVEGFLSLELLSAAPSNAELEASEWAAWAQYSLASPPPDPLENCQVFRRRHTYKAGIAEGVRLAVAELEERAKR
jgi:hypothetical protein